MNRLSALLFFITLGLTQFKTSAQSDSIEILSWNVFLRPAILFDSQMKRVDSIAHYLYNSDADIIIVQEAFHRRARKRLDDKLKLNYCAYTAAGPKSFFSCSFWCRDLFKGSIYE